jgi:hypothetical protein
MFKCHTYIWLFIQTDISQNEFDLHDSVLPENVLNEEQQALNSLIPEKSKGRRYLSEIIDIQVMAGSK